MKRVLLVDDSKTILSMAEMAVEDLVNTKTISFATYINPAELLKALESGEENYDLLVSDVNMPQLNGLELASKLKANVAFKNKPILILTTESSAQMKAKGKDIGVTGWLVKPFNNKKLIRAILMILGL